MFPRGLTKNSFRLPAWWRARVSAIQLVFFEFFLDFAETFACQNNNQSKKLRNKTEFESDSKNKK